MQVLTLTTDWNRHDYYTGVVKGFLLRELPDLKVVDISHNIPIFDYKKACYVVKAVYKFYPENTVHIVGIRGEILVENRMAVAKPIVIKAENQWFLGYNNGAFMQMFSNSKNVSYWSIPHSIDATFPEFDFLIKPAVAILKGQNIDDVFEKFDFSTSAILNLPNVTPSSITGIVEYIDGYGNIITNIQKSDFEKIRAGRRFEITVSRPQNKITQISTNYDAGGGDLVAVFNSLDKLEIAQINYKASYSIVIKEDSMIYIRFLSK